MNKLDIKWKIDLPLDYARAAKAKPRWQVDRESLAAGCLLWVPLLICVAASTKLPSYIALAISGFVFVVFAVVAIATEDKRSLILGFIMGLAIVIFIIGFFLSILFAIYAPLSH